jgi:general secretion pathway protein G
MKLNNHQPSTINHQHYSGFTLVEILVSATIIGLLTTIGITGFQAITKSGRDALRKSDLEQMRSALEVFKSENGVYPTGTAACQLALPTGYINKIPTDPKLPTYKYCYVWDANPLNYTLCAHLENGDATDNCGATNACGNGDLVQDNCNYQVANP